MRLVFLLPVLFASCAAQTDTTPRRIHGTVVFTASQDSVAFPTQNGGMVEVPRADLVGKKFAWVTTPAGEPPSNTTPIEAGTGVMPESLAVEFTTAARYPDGAHELAFYVLISGGDPTRGPQTGDLAAFDLSPALAGEPGLTGTTVRVRVAGEDADLALNNSSFIRFSR